MKTKKLVIIVLSLVLALCSVFALGGCKDKDPSASNNKLKIINVKLTDEKYVFAAKKGNTALIGDLNTYIAEIKGNGEYQKILDKYFKNEGTKVGYPVGNLSDPNALVIITNVPFSPFEYQGDDNKFYGVDIEIAAGFAAKQGKSVAVYNHPDFNTILEQFGTYPNGLVMAGLTYSADRAEKAEMSVGYYDASQKIIVKETDTSFDACTTVAEVEAVLKAKGKDFKVGFQNGTTSVMYVNGDEDWGFEGFANITSNGYATAALAAQDLVNGNLSAVVVDEAPGTAIVAALNAVN